MGKMFLSTESIGFQNKVFGKELENAFTAIQENCSTLEEVEKGDYASVIAAIIKKHTNINSIIKFGDWMVLCSISNTVSKNNILFSRKMAKYIPKYTSNEDRRMVEVAKKFNKENSVDLKNARVNGVFAEMQNDILFGVSYLFKGNFVKLTPGELTAVLLHELGHQFTFYEYLSREVTTNQVLAGLAETVNRRDPRRVALDIKLASDVLAVDKKHLEQVAQAETGEAVAAVVLDALKYSHDDIFSSGFYNETSAEQLADQFATRLGYGRELVTALDKSTSGLTRTNETGVFVLRLVECVCYAVYIQLAIMSYGALFGVVFAITITGLLGNPKWQNYTYDQTRTRYARIREQQIQALKNSDLPKDEVDYLVNSTSQIAKLMENSYAYTSVINVIFNKIFSGRREAINVLELNRELEELGNNDLFIKAAQLKQIA